MPRQKRKSARAESEEVEEAEHPLRRSTRKKTKSSDAGGRDKFAKKEQEEKVRDDASTATGTPAAEQATSTESPPPETRGEKQGEDAPGEMTEGQHVPEAAEVPSTESGEGPVKSPAQAQEQEDEEKEGVLEKGHVYFFYRPKVGVADVSSPNDVQRLLIVLKPFENFKSKARLIAVGRKRLPDPAKHDRFWGFVDKTSSEIREVTAGLGKKEYDTKTQGHREVGAAVPVGVGVYALVFYHASTHLVYTLELPTEPGEAQSAFGIQKQGSLILQVKNPDTGGPIGFSSGNRKPDLPESLSSKFRGRRFITVRPVAFLDHENTELLLIGARDNIEIPAGTEGADNVTKELKELEQEAEEEIDDLGIEKYADDKLFSELEIARAKRLLEPLIEKELA